MSDDGGLEVNLNANDAPKQLMRQQFNWCIDADAEASN
jgi:hypothetical protein